MMLISKLTSTVNAGLLSGSNASMSNATVINLAILGIFLTEMSAVGTVDDVKKKINLAFSTSGSLVAIIAVFFFYSSDVKLEISSILISGGFFSTSRVFLFGLIFLQWWCEFRRYYNHKRLNRAIIKFTKNADRGEEIKLFGGDLNFFGEGIYGEKNYIENNKQFKQLVNKRFRKLFILSKKPDINSPDKDYSDNQRTLIRYGRIFKEFGPTVEMRFYDDQKMNDWHLRGRLFKDHIGKYNLILFYNATDKRYRKVVYDPNKKEGNFYINYLNELWNRADKDEKGEIKKCCESCYLEQEKKNQSIKNQPSKLAVLVAKIFRSDLKPDKI